MAKRIIRTGTTADPTGDSLKNAFTKVNDNFTELYNALGLDADTLNLGAFEFNGSVMTTTDSSAITIDQAVTVSSDLTVGGDVVPQTALGGNLGSAAKPWHSLYVSNSTIYLGGTPLSLNGSGQLTVNGTSVSSTDKLAVGAKEVVLTGGANPYVTFPTVASGENIIIQGAEIASSNGAVAITSSDSVVINTNALTTLKSWTFDTYGAITLPGGNTITTASGFDLAPASGGTLTIGTGQYPWRFDDNDGSLTFPSGVRIESDVAGNTSIWGASNKFIQLRGAGTDGPILEPLGGILINSNGTTEIIAQTLSDSAAWTFNANDSLTFPDSTVQTTAYTGTANIARNIESESDVSIKVNLSDSTQRVWRFGEDGELTFPDSTVQSTAFTGNATALVNGSYSISAVYNGIDIKAPLTWKENNTDRVTLNYNNMEDGFVIATNVTGLTKAWFFNDDGSLELPGSVTFNDNTTQTTAWRGIPGPYADDAAAATAGVAVGYPYHKTGTSGQVFVRLT